jgi:hypothetical protein
MQGDIILWWDTVTGQPRLALVIFGENQTVFWLRWLHIGFRHCFVCISVNNHWVICDSLLHRTNLTVIEGVTASDLVRWYSDRGCTVVRTNVRDPQPECAALRPYTCVEAVKRILGIHAPWTFTPWQLYRRLIREKEK